MICLPLVRRTIGDYRWLWIFSAAGILGFLILFNFAMDAIPRENAEVWMNVPWIQKFVSTLVGSDAVLLTKPEGMLSVGFSHPMVWAMLLAFAFTAASGSIAAEIDRGTMDLLATLPVSRPAIYASTSIAVLLMGLVLCWMVWLGAVVGIRIIGVADFRTDWMAIAAANLCTTFVAIAGLSVALSAVAPRRGLAVAVAFGVVFYGFVLNFLKTMWPAAESIAFTSFLHYYEPLIVMRDTAWPWGHMAAMTATGIVFWTAGLIGFCVRDFPAR
jgi:ABC-type transport system involved in multi-copper enzyme maturation permease subunit